MIKNRAISLTIIVAIYVAATFTGIFIYDIQMHRFRASGVGGSWPGRLAKSLGIFHNTIWKTKLL